MKFKTAILATSLCLVMQTACAHDLKSELKQSTATQDVAKPSLASKQGNAMKYGMYQLQPDLIAVPQALANQANTRHNIADLSLVTRTADLDEYIEFRRNAVVRNSMTGEMGVVTGNISILSKKDADITHLLQQFNLKVIRSAGATGVYIVQPVNDVELLTLLQQIKASGLVHTARLDILEQKYSTQ
jgi:hypothetical protein